MALLSIKSRPFSGVHSEFEPAPIFMRIDMMFCSFDTSAIELFFIVVVNYVC